MAQRPARSHSYIPIDEKLRRGIRLNVYDAARGYRDRQGYGDKYSIRAILKEPEFRNAWRAFNGGRRTFGKRGTPTSLDQKMNAAGVFGWAEDPARDNTIKHLRGLYGRY